jgi:tetratricopeptide (TPR) repeat protein
LKDILRPESFASIVQKDFEQFHEAKVAFDAKLRTYFQQAKELSQNYHYDAAIKELQKIIALTRKMDSDDLSHNQVLMLADTYAALASILRVGSSEEGILALRCCDNAIELNPAHAEAIAMRRSLLSEHAVFPTDSYTDFMEEQQDNKTHNLT